jgi:hypothetical protein
VRIGSSSSTPSQQWRLVVKQHLDKYLNNNQQQGVKDARAMLIMQCNRIMPAATSVPVQLKHTPLLKPSPRELDPVCSADVK